MIGVERGESKNRERLERWYKWGVGVRKFLSAEKCWWFANR